MKNVQKELKPHPIGLKSEIFTIYLKVGPPISNEKLIPAAVIRERSSTIANFIFYFLVLVDYLLD